MALTTYKTFLMYKASASADYTKLIDIKDFPDLGGVPEMLDATTLSNGFRVYELGIQETEALTFTANYSATDYSTLVGLADTEYDFAVWIGGTVAGSTLTPSGSDGKWSFKGKLAVTKTGGSVNAIQDMTITIAPTTDITFSAS